ncbi:5-hydroxyisourate hydrolase [Arthrobacter ulcerisalmonis]|uniref:hydroxyisourate hydrolase n=1 Tax=Arthrobacter sp. B1I2 TaxID=3042263 RepID=UPI0027801B79|nr:MULTISPECIES: hydroxyisourate hydrolase [Arthrobacter]MDQ0662738.1 5-hydroxyisourate hydrolase [Arthrobacter ulcerisalmonis]MDQ0730628.1 5-hydroxyisourate hydrolase [Arthrobacter sp. B1I2]
MSVSHVTTHILDTGAGRPAAGVAVVLLKNDGGTWRKLATSSTDADGRAKDLGPEQLEPGNYKLNFATGKYYAGLQTQTFFPEVDLVFEVTGPEHYHVPLLLSPFAYSTYRGS